MKIFKNNKHDCGYHILGSMGKFECESSTAAELQLKPVILQVFTL